MNDVQIRVYKDDLSLFEARNEDLKVLFLFIKCKMKNIIWSVKMKTLNKAIIIILLQIFKPIEPKRKNKSNKSIYRKIKENEILKIYFN